MNQSKSELIAFIEKSEEAFRDHLKKGGFFNIFNELRITTNETKHSLFLASVLNPNGAHGLGSLPLERFLEAIGDHPFDSELDNIEVKTEYVIPNGRIDILIEQHKPDNTKSAIVIENKIYARDQPNQLQRYHDFAKKFGDNFNIVYLSLSKEGKPSDDSLGELELQDIKCISYEIEILSWLKEVKNESDANGASLFKEVLENYIDVLNEITGQQIEFQIKKEESKFSVAEFVSFRDKLRLDFMKALQKRLESDFDTVQPVVKVHDEVKSLDEPMKPLQVNNYVGLKLTKCGKELFVEIQDYDKIIYGVFNEKNKDKKEQLQDKGFAHDTWWLYKEFKIYTKEGLTFPFYHDRLNYKLMKQNEILVTEFADILLQTIEDIPK